MLLIGSAALVHLGCDIGRVPRDTDLIGSYDELGVLTRALRKRGCGPVVSIPLSQNKTVLRTEKSIIEFEIAWTETTAARLVDLVCDGTQRDMGYLAPGLVAAVPTLDMLYTLKMSHRYLKDSPHFRKTRDDIMLMRSLGAAVFDTDWLKHREAETYVNKLPKLNVMKGDFFRGDGVEYVYDHDTIHVAMAHIGHGTHFPGMPAYVYYMKDGAQVQSDKKKFFDLPEQYRLWGVLEEAQVLALERSQIPFRGKADPRWSFEFALQKVCTSITGGWFREFAWENFHRVLDMYESDYVDRFWKAVDDGVVRRIVHQ